MTGFSFFVLAISRHFSPDVVIFQQFSEKNKLMLATSVIFQQIKIRFMQIISETMGEFSDAFAMLQRVT
jgi:hypothetical protein